MCIVCIQYVYAYIAYVYGEDTYRRCHILEMDSVKREVMKGVKKSYGNNLHSILII